MFAFCTDMTLQSFAEIEDACSANAEHAFLTIVTIQNSARLERLDRR